MEPTFAACRALVRQHLWRARYVVKSTPEAEYVQFPREALELLLMPSLSLAASWPKSSTKPIDYSGLGGTCRMSFTSLMRIEC
jgi:hypothetical protein